MLKLYDCKGYGSAMIEAHPFITRVWSENF